MKFLRSLALFPLFVLALLSIACASGSNLPVEEPEITIVQADAPTLMQEQGGLIGVHYVVEIWNYADVPITADRIELSTPSAGPYNVRNLPIEVDKTIQPDSGELIELSTEAYSRGGRTAALEPVTLRITVYFESSQGEFRVTKVERIRQSPAL